MKRHIYVFRHGETDWNRAGRFQGHADVELNPTGREQARALSELIRELGLGAILSSDLQRALETARIASNGLDIPIHSHPGLREAHMGEVEGLTYDQIIERFGEDALRAWRSEHFHDLKARFEGGESGAEVVERIMATIGGFLGELDHERIGISTHGGVIRRLIQNVNPGVQPPLVKNGQVFYFTVDPDGTWTFFGKFS